VYCHLYKEQMKIEWLFTIIGALIGELWPFKGLRTTLGQSSSLGTRKMAGLPIPNYLGSLLVEWD
jgi:hypothetical protein